MTMTTTLEMLRADLIAHGYVDIPEYKGITVGTRVHHRSERYYEALRDGTAEVLALMEKTDSSWSRHWGERDIELIVRRDLPGLGDNLVQQWADHHTRVPRADW